LSELEKSVAQFVAAAVRRLWWLQSLRRLQTAAGVSLLAAALAAGTHTLLVALPAWSVLLAVSTPVLLAGLAALAARPTAQQAAWWADRNLAGASLFSTWQDFLLARNASASARAQLGLQTRTAAALRQSSAQLATMHTPGQVRLFWVSASCVLLCGIVLLADGRRRQPPIAASVVAAVKSQTDAVPTAATARDELRRALLTEARDPATRHPSADAASEPPTDDDPGSQLARSRGARTAATASGDGAATGGLGAGTGRGRSSTLTTAKIADPQLTERFRRIGGTRDSGFDGAADGEGYASSFGALLGADRDYDSRQALLARRVAPADAATNTLVPALNPSAIELMRRYAAIKEPLR
jgi:hypothetical protein